MSDRDKACTLFFWNRRGKVLLLLRHNRLEIRYPWVSGLLAETFIAQFLANRFTR